MSLFLYLKNYTDMLLIFECFSLEAKCSANLILKKNQACMSEIGNAPLNSIDFHGTLGN